MHSSKKKPSVLWIRLDHLNATIGLTWPIEMTNDKYHANESIDIVLSQVALNFNLLVSARSISESDQRRRIVIFMSQVKFALAFFVAALFNPEDLDIVFLPLCHG